MPKSNTLNVLGRFITKPKDFAREWRRTNLELAQTKDELARGQKDLRDELFSAVESVRAELQEAIRAAASPTASSASETVSTVAQSLSDRVEQLRHRFFLPVHGISPAVDGPYMAYSTCSAADMKNRQYVEFCEAVNIAKLFHRKYWEWAFVTHHLQRLGVIGPGNRGLVFGVGMEPLPSYFASLGAQIVATDAPSEVGESQGWIAGNQFADSVERLWRECSIDRNTFLQRVCYESCDMTNISPHLTCFDFCWSSCCFEHLGSLEAGMDFVVNSVEKTLRPGGVAVHTTEFNLSSNEETIIDGPTVIYRKRDIESLIQRLRDRGHIVSDLRIAPDVDPLDFYVDAPPYSVAPHLKLRLWDYAATSVGLVIQRKP
jgi:SAM-dependent methyltransferase